MEDPDKNCHLIDASMLHTRVPGVSKTRSPVTAPTQQQGMPIDRGKSRDVPGAPRATRSMESEGERLSRKEIENQTGQEVTNANKGMKYLEATLLMVPGMPYMAMELVRVLFHISMFPGIKNSLANTNAVRVAAFILADLDMEA